MMRKVYRAVSERECEEMWVGESVGEPEGWHGSDVAALKAFRQEKPKRGPGRPRKSSGGRK